MLSFLKSLFQTPSFAVGSQVNLLNARSTKWWTTADQTDGRVLAQNRQGVLVEWPRDGLRWVDPDDLCQQA
jgi:hypothetical protein